MFGGRVEEEDNRIRVSLKYLTPESLLTLQVLELRSMAHKGADREGLLFVVLSSIIYLMKIPPGYPSHVLNDEDYTF